MLVPLAVPTPVHLTTLSLRTNRYYQEKGFWVIVTARVLSLLALGFTAGFSGFLLLWVDWGALHSECLQQDTCDILDVRFRQLLPACTKWLPHLGCVLSVTSEAIPKSVDARRAGGRAEAPAAAWRAAVVGGAAGIPGAAGPLVGLEPGAPGLRPQEPRRGGVPLFSCTPPRLIAQNQRSALRSFTTMTACLLFDVLLVDLKKY